MALAYHDSVWYVAAKQATQLILELQTLAYDAHHPAPLLIALDQENGGVNSLFDESFITQFPSAMGVAASNSKSLAHEIALASGRELKAVGFNWILGPVLDVLSHSANRQPLGVRSFGHDPQEVSQYALAFMKGYQESGLATCGKHFPSYGNLAPQMAVQEVPVISESLEQLGVSALVPFREAINHGLDAMLVGGASAPAVDAAHACLSATVVDDLLRNDLDFDGIVLSECLEMEELARNVGVAGGTVMAKNAGCDVMLVCRSFRMQQEAIRGLKLGVENEIIGLQSIERSIRRMLRVKSKYCGGGSWERALNPPGVEALSRMHSEHSELSRKAYDGSMSLVRDKNTLLPLTNILEAGEEVLLLTPLVKPLAASSLTRAASQQHRHRNGGNTDIVMVGMAEGVFQTLGRTLAQQRKGRVLHTSYTTNGVRPEHESLIDRASVVVVVTADGGRNLYQESFARYVSLLCRMRKGESGEKPLIIVASSSPDDFVSDSSISTYLCTYDFTEAAQRSLTRVLTGKVTPVHRRQKAWKQQHHKHSRTPWLVEDWQEERDAEKLDLLLGSVAREEPVLQGVRHSNFLLRCDGIDEWHFVVRNSSTDGALYGFCASYFFRSTGTGVIGAVIVDRTRRRQSIGRTLHKRAMRRLLFQQEEEVKRMQLGSRLPGVYLGIPTERVGQGRRLRKWFSRMGWNTALSRRVSSLFLHFHQHEEEGKREEEDEMGKVEYEYDVVYGVERDVADHVRTATTRAGVVETYRIAMGDNSHTTNNTSGVIRARRKGVLMGCIVIYGPQSILAEKMPRMEIQPVWGISSPVVSSLVGEYSSVVQGLITRGIRQIRQYGAKGAIFDCVSGSFFFFFPFFFFLVGGGGNDQLQVE